MTDAEIIEVVTAKRDGKKIEHKAKEGHGCEKWITADNPAWNFEFCDYRVAPEPMVIWVNVYPNRRFEGESFVHSEEVSAQCALQPDGKTLRFVQDLDYKP